ncbi:hypothetical protein ACPUEK_16395 [Marinomonas gallaica]|uniref:hypothetical protein n=1 Tax=Marinomonas gallaica TaxID=1806667 RepID=UPI00082ED5F0|nr:hypothetical protein [Marinomonas gallaica]
MSQSAGNKDQSDAQDSTPPKKSKLPIGLVVSFLLCFLISVSASAALTYFLTSSNNNEEMMAETQTKVENQLNAMRQSIEQQNTQLSAISAENETLKTYLRHSSANALKNILIDQEENIQAYLAVMRQAIGDLSDMLPNSSDWETTYQYQMDLALKASMERTTLLNLLKTGEPQQNNSSLPPKSPTKSN